jgi:hypothetical protein
MGRENISTIGWPTPTTMPGLGKTLAVTASAGGAVVNVEVPWALSPPAPTTSKDTV